MTSALRSRMIPLWLVYCLTAVMIFGVWGALSKAAGERLSAWQVQVFSTFGMLPVAAAAACARTFLTGSNLPRGVFWAFVTGLANAAGNVALFAAFEMGAEASVIVPLTAMYPLVTILVARLVLKERLTPAQKTGVVLSLVAILMFSMEDPPDSSADPEAGPPAVQAADPAGAGAALQAPATAKQLWLGLAGICLLGFGISGVTQKVATRYISDHMSICAFIAANVPISLAIAAVRPIEWSVGWTSWLLSLAIGLSIGVSTLLLFAAFTAGGKAGIVTAMGALYPGITVVLAVWLFGETITPTKAVGIFVALIAGVLLTREHSDAVPVDGDEPPAPTIEPPVPSVGTGAL